MVTRKKVDLPFGVTAGNRDNVIIDLIGVDFVASIVFRPLAKAGRPIGKIVLCNPNEAVRKVLSSTGVDEDGGRR